MLVPARSFPQDFSGFWEENGLDEELLFLLEYSGYQGLLNAHLAGFKLDTLSFPGFSSDIVSSITPHKFRFTSRFTGNNLQHRLFRQNAHFAAGWEISLLAESDPGEKWNDFTAGYLQKKSPRLTLTAGNYSAGFAQGLVLWRGFNWAAYPENPLSAEKQDFLRGYSSPTENGALFGIAAHYHPGKYSLLTGFSHSRWDASASENGIASLQTSGIHNTDTELANRDRLQEKSTFARFRTAIISPLQIGLSALYSQYHPAFAPADSLRETFDFSGDDNYVYSADFTAVISNLTSSLELAKSKSGGQALAVNNKIALPPVQISLSYLNCSEKFSHLRSLYPEGNIEQTILGLTFPAWKNAQIHLLYDYYIRPWRTYSEEIPPANCKTSFCLEQKWNSQVYSLRIRRTVYEGTDESRTTRQFRFTWRGEFSQSFYSFRGEILQSALESETSTGKLVSIGWGRRFFPGYLDLTALAFNISAYDCRIYHYLDDVPGAGSTSFYYGNGFAGNAVVKLNLPKGFTLAFKSGFTQYSWRPNQETGSFEKDFSLYLNYAGDIF